MSFSPIRSLQISVDCGPQHCLLGRDVCSNFWMVGKLWDLVNICRLPEWDTGGWVGLLSLPWFQVRVHTVDLDHSTRGEWPSITERGGSVSLHSCGPGHSLHLASWLLLDLVQAPQALWVVQVFITWQGGFGQGKKRHARLRHWTAHVIGYPDISYQQPALYKVGGVGHGYLAAQHLRKVALLATCVGTLARAGGANYHLKSCGSLGTGCKGGACVSIFQVSGTPLRGLVVEPIQQHDQLGGCWQGSHHHVAREPCSHQWPCGSRGLPLLGFTLSRQTGVWGSSGDRQFPQCRICPQAGPMFLQCIE